MRPRLMARRLVHSFQRQMMEDNRFHGDMHPGTSASCATAGWR